MKIDYDNYSIDYFSHAAYKQSLLFKKELEEKGFRFLGWSASEGLYMTGAWREDEKYVYCLSDGEPYYDDLNGIIHPDPFNMPQQGKEVCLAIYEKPFKPSEYDGEEWVMDGTAPVNINDENQQITQMYFEYAKEAIEFCDWLSAQAKK